MNYKSLISTIGMCSALFASSLFMTNCTPMVSEEQLQLLQDLRKKEKTLTGDISAKQVEIQKLEKELNARKAEVDNCNKDREFVKQKLAQWPNVWPDYNPNEPAPAAAPTK